MFDRRFADRLTGERIDDGAVNPSGLILRGGNYRKNIRKMRGAFPSAPRFQSALVCCEKKLPHGLHGIISRARSKGISLGCT